MKRNKYLLDTNICIALLRGGNRNVATRLIEAGEGNCSLSVITVYELMFGAYHSQHESREVPKIAATALTHNLVLVTDNTKHFQRITGLRLENWIR